MKFSLTWLRNYIDLNVTVPEMLDRLTLTGTEVENSRTLGVSDPNLIVGQVISFVQHPNADRLRLCRVNDGTGERVIVCGAKNFTDGDKVPLALPGARLPGDFHIKESKIRGELSQGMLCSAKELGLSDDAEGLLLLAADAPVGKAFHEYMPGDTEFEVEITSNRPDLLSYRGLARELAAAGVGVLKAAPLAAPEYLVAPECPFSIHLMDEELCPFYTLVHLSDVKVGPSPDWLQKAILSTGHRPINNVVDITNFVLFETGQPLHAFSADRITGNKIEVRRAKEGETLLALDTLTYKLTHDHLIIADGQGPLGIAGVMGGKPSGVDNQTTEILLEAAWFLPASIRRTSRALGLSSDSSYRYERRVDSHRLLAARDRAVSLFQEVCGAKLVSAPAVSGQPQPLRQPITLRHERITRLLGLAIPDDAVKGQLSSLGCEMIPGENRENGVEKEPVSIWQAPSWRDDLAREVDLIEEVARMTGMDKIPEQVRASGQPESDTDRHSHRTNLLRRFLANHGYDECVTDPLQSKEVAELNGSGPAAALHLVNPLNEQYSHLRPALKTCLLKVAAHSLAKGTPGCRLFELGKVYQPSPDGKTTAEPLHLGILVAGMLEAAAWFQKERAAELYDLTGLLQTLEKSCGVKIEGALVSGELTPLPSDLAAKFGLKIPVYYAELDLTSWLGKATPEPQRYQPLPTFPSVRRDVAVLVPRATPQAAVEAVIRKAAPKILENVTLFDLFLDEKGEKIAADLKSLAYALTFRSPDRTLTEKEVNKAFDDIKAVLVKELSCSFREGK